MTQDTKEKAIEWLLSQGVSTVLLCAILGFLGYAVAFMIPDHLQMIQSGYEKNSRQFTESLDRITESHEKDRQMFLDILEARYHVGARR